MPQTYANTKLYIGTKAVATDIPSYAADTYTQVKGIKSMPPLGDASNELSIALMEDGRQQDFKGIKNSGGGTYGIAFDAADPGQQALIAAEADTSSTPYNFYREYEDGRISYFSGLVFSFNEAGGEVEDFIMIDCVIKSNTPILTA